MRRASDPTDPRLRRWILGALSGLLLVTAAIAATPPWLVDETDAWGLRFRHDNGATGELYFAEIMGAGAALVDYDGDGDLDAYLIQGGPLRRDADSDPSVDRLFRNDLRVDDAGRTVPRFVDVTGPSRIRAAEHGMGIGVADFDGNAFPDFYLASFGDDELWTSQGDGTFRETSEASGVGDGRWGVVAVPFDIEGDGDVDLFVGNYTGFSLATHKACFNLAGGRDYCSPRTYAPVTNRLWRNRGDGSFEDVSAPSGLGSLPGTTLGAVAADFDGDGLLDLYEANDLMENRLWRNRGDGSFEDVGLLSGAALGGDGAPEASMGVAVADLDGDLDQDLFVTHLDNQKSTLYLNEGAWFRDATVERGLGAATWPFTGFGVCAPDLDLDGAPELFTVNGAVTILQDLAARGDPFPFHQRDQLFQNLGEARFREVSPDDLPVLDDRRAGRGAALGDVDLDGIDDVLVSNNHGDARILAGRRGVGRHWLAVRIVDPSGRDLLGTAVTISRGETPLHRDRIATDGSYASASAPVGRAGLGADSAAVEVEASLPFGRRIRMLGLPTDRVHVLVTPAPGGSPP